jgi:hypothetical protein
MVVAKLARSSWRRRILVGREVVVQWTRTRTRRMGDLADDTEAGLRLLVRMKGWWWWWC